MCGSGGDKKWLEKSLVVAGGQVEKKLTIERERKVRSVMRIRIFFMGRRKIRLFELRAMLEGWRTSGRQKEVKGEEKKGKLS